LAVVWVAWTVKEGIVVCVPWARQGVVVVWLPWVVKEAVTVWVLCATQAVASVWVDWPEQTISVWVVPVAVLVSVWHPCTAQQRGGKGVQRRQGQLLTLRCLAQLIEGLWHS
jgi:glycerol-3-phosphate acyltransferase PlsY